MFKLLGQQLRKPSGLSGKMVAFLMNRRSRKFYLKIIEKLEIDEQDKICEIGYGPGLGIHLIAGARSGCSISGVDFSPLMFETASGRNRKFIDNKRVRLYQGDFLTIDMHGEMFNKIFCINFVYFFKELAPLFNRIHSLLNVNGIFFIYMDNAEWLKKMKFAKDFNKHSIEHVEDELRKAGFGNIESEFNHGYYIKSGKNI